MRKKVFFDDNLRQQGDEAFFKILQEIRMNKLSDTSFDILCSRITANPNVTLPPPTEVQPIMIYPKKYMVNKVNNE